MAGPRLTVRITIPLAHLALAEGFCEQGITRVRGRRNAPSHPARASEGAILACATIAPSRFPPVRRLGGVNQPRRK